MDTMQQFFTDGSRTKNGVNKAQADAIESLFNHYKKDSISSGHVILCFEWGFPYGNIYCIHVDNIRNPGARLKYEGGSYDYVDINGKEQYMYFGIPSDITEPYDHQQPLYVPCSWRKLTCHFHTADGLFGIYNTGLISTNTTRGVWGFMYNDFWDLIRFGICIVQEDYKKFIGNVINITHGDWFGMNEDLPKISELI